MVEHTIAIFLIWTLLFVYSMLGSIDFGASFWAMYYYKRHTQAGELANRFLSPTWEITNTFLVLLVVAFVGFFPNAVYILGTVLLIPVGFILILLSIRSAFMVFAYSLPKYEGILRIVSGVTGLLVPMLLISALPVTTGGMISADRGTEILLYKKWLTSPSTYFYMLFGLTSELFLSSLFLADYAREFNREEVYLQYRSHAVRLGPFTLLTAVITILFFEPEAAWMIKNLREHTSAFLWSIIFYLIAYSALWIRRKNGRIGLPRLSVIAVVIQYAIASYAYGAAHLPYLVYPQMTVAEGFTKLDTFYALLWVFGIGLAIMLPGFYLFWKLFLKDKRYLQKQ